MNTNEHFAGKSIRTRTVSKSRYFIIRFSQLLFLVSILVILTGHEVSNPKVGKSIVDFYLDDITKLIQTQSSILLVHSEYDSTGHFEDYINKLTASFYKERSYQPLWTYNFNTTAVFDTLVQLVDSMDYLGIPSKFINSEDLILLQRKFKEFNDDESLKYRIALEINATRILFKSLLVTHRGIFTHDTTIPFKAYTDQLTELTATAIKNHSINQLFIDNQPHILHYTKLVNAMSPFIYNRRAILSVQIDSLNQNEKLLATSFFYAGILKSSSFDSVQTKKNTIKQFQKISGLKLSGEIDSITFHKLIAVIDSRFYQLCINLDRLRKMEQTDKDYLFVNIPSFKLWIIKGIKATNSFNVVVGKKISPTPVLSSKINKVVANPYWTVPKSISRNEMIHKIRKDSTFLERNGYMVINNKEEIVEENEIDWSSNDPLSNKFWIRQKYGKNNALGQIKFLFPNDYRIYLHDTPSKKLFQKEFRAYSHGCVRIENPEILAQHIFDNYIQQEGDSLNIQTLIKSRERNVINLPVEIPIHIQYLTCMSNDDGKLEFYSDIYNLDKTLLKEFLSQYKRI